MFFAISCTFKKSISNVIKIMLSVFSGCFGSHSGHMYGYPNSWQGNLILQENCARHSLKSPY